MPTAPSPVLVTGATGTVGRLVVADLLARGASVRAAVTNPVRARTAVPAAADQVRFDFTDSSSWPAAFTGVDTVFVMRPPALGNVRRDLVPALDAARAAGVRHVVVLSLQGAGRNRIVPHAALEEWARGSGLGWTFVRPSFFMENLTGTHAGDVRDRDELCVPAGDGATSFVAAGDVAAVVTAALLDPGAHHGRAWTPTGPEALSYAEVAAVLSEVLGRPVRYTRPGVLRYALHARRTLGLPLPMVGVTTAIYTIARLGRAAGLTDDVRAVTGRAPVSFREWARQNVSAWQRPAP